MTEPIPGQLSLVPDLAPDLTETATGIAKNSGLFATGVARPLPGNGNEACDFSDLTGPAGRPTRPATDASQQRDGPHEEPTTGGRPGSVGRFWGLEDVPDELRQFADVPPGGRAWRMWDPGTPAAQAALEYRQRLGTWPAAVIRNPKVGHTLAGPLADRWREAPFS